MPIKLENISFCHTAKKGKEKKYQLSKLNIEINYNENSW